MLARACVTALSLVWMVSHAGAATCRFSPKPGDMSAVATVLRSTGMNSAQIAFAKAYSPARIRIFLSEPLSPDGVACGKTKIEGMLYGCVEAMWPRLAGATKESLLKPQRFSDAGFQARNIGEMLFISALNLCMGTARKLFLVAQ